MTSVKLKFRKSPLPKKEGTLYFQVIHNRVVKQIKTSYHIFDYEWDGHYDDIAQLPNPSPDRQNFIKSIKEKIAWEKKRLCRIIEKLENKGRPFSSDKIVQDYALSSNRFTVLEYTKVQIERLKNAGKDRTSETYRQMLLSFMKFRNKEDLHFDMIDENLICQYESYMRMANL